MRTKLSLLSKTITLIILVFLVMGCSNQEDIHSLKKGKYAWIKQSKLKLAYYEFVHNTVFELGDTLTLFDGVHFAYTNCGTYGFGKYKIVGDSLLLNYDSIATHRDSIMLKDKFTDVYFIEDENTLAMKFGSKVSKEVEASFFGISELHYIEDTPSNEE